MFRFCFIFSCLVLSACSSVQPADSSAANDSGFGEQKAAVRFLQPLFSTLDCEQVGEIEAGEVDEHFAQIYFFSDRDQSRSLSEAEYLRSIAHSDPQKDSFIFTLMDTNKDTLVTPMEFRMYTFKAIKLADTDGSGSVSEQEADQASFRQGFTKR